MKKVKFDGMVETIPELTELELKVVEYFSCYFNYSNIKDNVYDNATFFDFEEIANDTGISHNILRGVLSSLIKKELIDLDGSTWYGRKIIDGAGFNVTYKGIITYYYYFTDEFKQLTRCLKVGANPTIAFRSMNFDHKKNF